MSSKGIFSSISIFMRWLLTAVGAVFLILLLILGYRGYHFYKTIPPYLAEEREILPKMEYSDEELSLIKEKIAQLKSLEGMQDIHLSASELNLILRDEFDIAKQLRISVNNDTISVLYTFPFPLTGKHLNGTIDLKPSYTNHTINLSIQSMSAHNKELDNESIAIIEDTLTRIIYDQLPDTVLNAIHSVVIHDNHIYIVFNQNEHGGS